MNQILENNGPKEQRPTMVLVLAILSFIYIGYSLLGNISAIFNGPMSDEELHREKVQITKGINELQEVEGVGVFKTFVRGSIEVLEKMQSNHNLMIYTGIFIVLVGFGGVFLMLKGKKIGFHTYIIYSILSSIQIYLILNPSLFSNSIVVFNLFISGIFVLLYGLNLKWMK